MSAIATGTVKVDGAALFFRRQGAGPLLLLSAGGSGDADSFDGLAAALAASFTVVSFDRRGYARSPLDRPIGDAVIAIGTASSDAAALIAEHGDEPAFVFGSSLGAVVALDLLARYPERVRRLVAHEPPLPELQAERPPPEAQLRPMAGETAEQTLQRFRSAIGVSRPGSAATAAAVPSGARAANAAFFLAHEAPAVGRFRLDVAALAPLRDRLVFAGGGEGRAYFPYACATRAAALLKARFVEFPGTHAGFVQHPVEFAAALAALYR